MEEPGAVVVGTVVDLTGLEGFTPGELSPLGPL